jgi:hypothetical protein
MWTFLCVLVALLAMSAVPGAEEAKKPRGVFSGLKVGQSVQLKEFETSFTITHFEEGEVPQSHTVVEMGDNFVLLRGVAGVAETMTLRNGVLLAPLSRPGVVRTQGITAAGDRIAHPSGQNAG